MEFIRNGFVIAVLCAFSGVALADDSKPTAQDLIGRLDFAVPQSPAFTVLGLSPEGVVAPSSYRTLALSLLNGLDADGHAQKGLAIDAKPYLISRGPTLTLDTYRTDQVARQLARVQVSFATASGQDTEDRADRYSLAVRWTPWDMGDPRMDFDSTNYANPDTLEGCYREAIVIDDDASTFDPDNYSEERLTALDKAAASKAKACLAASEARNWNASSWDIGLAGLRVDAPTGQNEDGGALWSSLGLRMGKNAQLIAHVRYEDNVLETDGTTYDPLDSFQAGARLKYGNPRGALLLEVMHIDKEDSTGASVDGVQYLVGTEFRIANGFWVHLAIGDRTGDLASAQDDLIFSSQLRWAFSDSSLLK